MAARFAFLDWPGPIPFAHRGGASEAPENTLPAFQHAVELGFRYVETDVHATRDGVLVAFHDSELDRVTDRSGRIAELDWDEVHRARVGGREPIPTLTELLHTFPDVRVNIDPKHDAAIDPLVEVLRSEDAVERVCVGAFSDKRIEAIRRRLGPNLCTGMGPRQIAKLIAADKGLPTTAFTAAAAQVPFRRGPVQVTTPKLVRAAHERDIAVHVWTVDDPAEMHRLLDMGVDGIMTDRPATLRDVLRSRGQWVEP